MLTRWLLFILSLVATPAFASSPGSPLDCSDLVLEPGLRCTRITNPGEGGFLRLAQSTIDNDGRPMNIGDGSTNDILENLGPCGPFDIAHRRLVYTFGPAAAPLPVVSVRSRCVDASDGTVESMGIGGALFDAVGGALVLALTSSCFSAGDGCAGFSGGRWLARIDGFPTIADKLGQPSSDTDGDGVPDGSDRCTETPSGATVDAEGCSQVQHCAAISVDDIFSYFQCWQSDWRDDESTRWPNDCRVDASSGFRCEAQ